MIEKEIFFNRFEEIGSSIDQIEDDEEQNLPSNGFIRSARKSKTPKEHVNIQQNSFLVCINSIYF